MITSPVEARPQYILQLPGPSWAPLVAAVFTAAFFLSLTVKLVTPALVCGAVAVVSLIWWLWMTDPGPTHPPADIGGGLKLPVYMNGPSSHSWWAMVVLLIVAGMVFGCLVFSYLFLWTVNVAGWLPPVESMPELRWALSSALWVGSSILIALGSWALRRSDRFGQWPTRLALLAAIGLVLVAIWIDIYAQWAAGLRPTDFSYAAIVYTLLSWQGFVVGVLLIMGLYTVARSLCGLIGSVRRQTFDNTMLMWHYAVAQSLVILALIHFFPRLAA